MIIRQLAPISMFKAKQPRQETSANWDDRKVILKDQVNLFCWRRSPDPVIERYLSSVLEKCPKPIKLDVNHQCLSQQLHKARKLWDVNMAIEGEVFWEDVCLIVNDFLDFSNTKSGTLHLKIVENNACKKFHTDGYSLRLFTTYHGRGTEWLTEKGTNRRGLGKTNQLIVKDPSQIRRMKAFEVGILKGEAAGSRSGQKGIVHRSPEIEQDGKKRIILRVDI